ncbi:MAG: hypothetical protein QMA97_00955 [Glaciecola sp.]
MSAFFLLTKNNTKAIFVGELAGSVEAQEGIAQQLPRVTFPYPSSSG